MNKSRTCIGLLGLGMCASLGSCASAGPDSNPENVGETTVGTVQQAFTGPLVYNAVGDDDGVVTSWCPQSTPFLLGTGGEALASLGFERLVPADAAPPNRTDVRSFGEVGNVTARAVCSDVGGVEWVGTSSTGNLTVTCPSGTVATGGGAICTGGGRLFRSRPSPDSDGSKPTGWRSSCTSGSIKAYAICVSEDDGFNTCRTERVDSSGTATVNCPVNRTAVSAGGYCGGSSYLFSLKLDSANLSWTKAACAGGSTSVHAYAVCC